MEIPAIKASKWHRGRIFVILSMALMLGILILSPAYTQAATGNQRPTANAGKNQEVITGAKVSLDGSKSYDPDHDTLSYSWKITAQPDGSVAFLDDASSSEPSFIVDLEGPYRVQLVVSDGKINSKPATMGVNSAYGRLSNPISPDDYQTIASYGNSCLTRNSAGKRVLYLEGGAYERGFATGYLCPKAVYGMTHDFVQNMVVELLKEVGIDLDLRAYPVIWDFLWSLMKVAVAANQDAIPNEFIQEMQGMADACRHMGYDVSFLDVVTLNAGFDAIASLYAGFMSFLCNEFAIFDDATTDGRLYHGRDFMFSTGGKVLCDEALMIVYNPDSGYPFVASSAPGFVGVPTAINTQGVSCGVDVVMSLLTRPLITGEGCLLLCRKAAQYGGSLDEAVSLIRDSDRAVPWLYMIADGDEGDACVLETVASSLMPAGDNAGNFLNRLLIGVLGIFFPWLNQSLENARGGVIDENRRSATGSGDLKEELAQIAPEGAGPVMENGVMIRDVEYIDPDWLNGLQYWFDPSGGSNPILDFFPRQLETYPDLVAMTNHYIIPWMAVTYPAQNSDKANSIWRYKTMMGLLDDCYGEIDRERAMWIIDFLNPARCDYYGTDTSQPVRGHHVLMDNRAKEMWSLHGYYNDPWAHVDLEEFLSRFSP